MSKLLKKVRVPARTLYRIDWPSKQYENFYREVWHSRKAAQRHIDNLNPKYRDQLVIVEFHEPEHDSWQGTIKL